MNETSKGVAKAILNRAATVFKLIGVALLVLLLLIPLHMIRSTLKERLGRRNEAVAEITSTWGKEQTFVGPVLVIPYRQGNTANAYFLPAALTIDGEIKPNKDLKRGIYRAIVYSGKLKFAGKFARPDFAALSIQDKDVLWDDAVVIFAITDLRGAKETLQLKWGEQTIPLTPGSRLSGFPSGVQAKVPGLRNGSEVVPFEIALSFNGSTAVSFAPVGMQTSVKLTSPWPDPSFRGGFLPSKRAVTASGFEAEWQVSSYGRDFAQQWTDQTGGYALNATTANASLFGVAFLDVVDAYRNVERAIKYGVLFLALVFATFFLFEILSTLRIHTFQYTLVGAALCLFYLALLSLSEFIPFQFAYLAAALAATLMISLYCLKVLRSGKRTLIVTGGLASIYGFLYVTLQLQDYSLLAGTAGLFLMLAVIMYVTRNIDWYARDRTHAATATPPPLPETPS